MLVSNSYYADKFIRLARHKAYDDLTEESRQNLAVYGVSYPGPSQMSDIHYALKMHTRGLFLDPANFDTDFNVSLRYQEEEATGVIDG